VGLDTLEVFRRDLDSHAIALYILSWEWHKVTRWGLFSLRWVHNIFFGSIAYGKRSYSSRDWDTHSYLRWCEGSQLTETCCSDALSKELDPVEMRLFQVMNTNIESSTEGARVKSDAPVDDTICVMVSDELSKCLHLFLAWQVSLPTPSHSPSIIPSLCFTLHLFCEAVFHQGSSDIIASLNK